MANRTTSRRSQSGSGQRARQAGRSAAISADSPWVRDLGQVGVAAIGVVYLLVAWISLQVAFGSASKSADSSGALEDIAGQPFGKVLLAAMAVGLFAYAIWQVILAIVGFPRKRSGERTFKRSAAAAKAVFGAALGAQTLTFVLRSGNGSGSKSSSQMQEDWTVKLLSLPAGRLLVILVGLALVALAIYLTYEGIEKKFLEKLVGRPSKRIVRLGQVGWIARGVTFGVLGVLVVVAGATSQPAKARGLDNAFKTLAQQPYGKWLLTAVAFGLASYGVFQLVTARTHKEG